MTWSVHLLVNCAAQQTETEAANAMKTVRWQCSTTFCHMTSVKPRDLRPCSVALLTIHVVLCQSAVPDISKSHSALIFRVKQPFLIGQLDPECACTVTIPNIWKYWPSHIASCPRRLHLSAKPTYDTWILQHQKEASSLEFHNSAPQRSVYNML